MDARRVCLADILELAVHDGGSHAVAVAEEAVVLAVEPGHVGAEGVGGHVAAR